ncbi:MAG TPA: hypothetical protein VHE83_08955 [Mycobacteriales bacterium]|nr:hypothetical protein [Mycobacteriales bacterium]
MRTLIAEHDPDRPPPNIDLRLPHGVWTCKRAGCRQRPGLAGWCAEHEPRRDHSYGTPDAEAAR